VDKIDAFNAFRSMLLGSIWREKMSEDQVPEFNLLSGDQRSISLGLVFINFVALAATGLTWIQRLLCRRLFL
jgi:hypothetical protein